MSTKLQLQAALANASVQIANLNHAKGTIEMRREAALARFKAECEALDDEVKATDKRLEQVTESLATVKEQLAKAN